MKKTFKPYPKMKTWLERDEQHRAYIIKDEIAVKYKNNGPEIRNITLQVNVNSKEDRERAIRGLLDLMESYGSVEIPDKEELNLALMKKFNLTY